MTKEVLEEGWFDPYLKYHYFRDKKTLCGSGWKQIGFLIINVSDDLKCIECKKIIDNEGLKKP